jgi:NAD(P)H-hydrate epimerase
MLLYSGSQVRELDRQVISDYGVPDLVLMEAAALGAARVLADRYRLASLGRAVIVCGRGNNGGDGAALSRHLVQAGCRDVVICLADGDGRLSPSMRTNLDIAVAYGIPVRQDVPGEVNGAGLVVDAILGTGVTGNPRDACAAAISAINGACGGKNVVALDVPSGLDSDLRLVSTSWACTVIRGRIMLATSRWRLSRIRARCLNRRFPLPC